MTRNVIKMKNSIDMRFPYVKLIVISGKEILMLDRCMKMISYVEDRVLVIIDVVVLRVLGGLIIMGSC